MQTNQSLTINFADILHTSLHTRDDIDGATVMLDPIEEAAFDIVLNVNARCPSARKWDSLAAWQATHASSRRWRRSVAHERPRRVASEAAMEAKDSSLIAFTDDCARIRYATRVAEMIADAMRDDQRLTADMLLRGRIGLAEMTDEQLLEAGAEAWGVLPLVGELRPALH